MIPALSLTRPWPTLILRCGKEIENRTWPTRYRGPLLIHAARSWDATALDFAENVEVLLDRNLGVSAVPWHADDNPTGLVGLVDLVDICPCSDGCDCGPWAAPDRYHWRLANPRPFANPIPCRGRLGLWTPPAELAAAIERELNPQMCELCHGTPASRTWKGLQVCTGCGDYGDYYDSLTPAERRAEEESIARHVAETTADGGA